MKTIAELSSKLHDSRKKLVDILNDFNVKSDYVETLDILIDKIYKITGSYYRLGLLVQLTDPTKSIELGPIHKSGDSVRARISWGDKSTEFWTTSEGTTHTYDSTKYSTGDQVAIVIQFPHELLEIPDLPAINSLGAGGNVVAVSLPEGLTKVPAGFSGAGYLKYVYMPDSVTTILGGALSSSSISYIDWSSNLERLEDGCLTNVSNLLTLQVPASVTYIGSGCFGNAGNNYADPISLTFPDTITYIGSGAYSGCNNITEVNMNASIDLTSSIMPSTDAARTIRIGPAVKSIQSGYAQSNNAEVIYIDDENTNIAQIPPGCFSGCSKLKSVKLNNSVNLINSGAFSGCDKLSSVSLPSQLKVIDSGAFQSCTSLKKIDIPEGVTHIGSSAFAYTALSKLTLPSTVKYVGDTILGNDDKLESFTVVSNPNDPLRSLLYLSLGSTSTRLTIRGSSNIMNIPADALSKCTSLSVSSVDLSSSINYSPYLSSSGTSEIKYFSLSDTVENTLKLTKLNESTIELSKIDLSSVKYMSLYTNSVVSGSTPAHQYPIQLPTDVIGGFTNQYQWLGGSVYDDSYNYRAGTKASISSKNPAPGPYSARFNFDDNLNPISRYYFNYDLVNRGISYWRGVNYTSLPLSGTIDLGSNIPMTKLISGKGLSAQSSIVSIGSEGDFQYWHVYRNYEDCPLTHRVVSLWYTYDSSVGSGLVSSTNKPYMDSTHFRTISTTTTPADHLILGEFWAGNEILGEVGLYRPDNSTDKYIMYLAVRRNSTTCYSSNSSGGNTYSTLSYSVIRPVTDDLTIKSSAVITSDRLTNLVISTYVDPTDKLFIVVRDLTNDVKLVSQIKFWYYGNSANYDLSSMKVPAFVMGSLRNAKDSVRFSKASYYQDFSAIDSSRDINTYSATNEEVAKWLSDRGDTLLTTNTYGPCGTTKPEVSGTVELSTEEDLLWFSMYVNNVDNTLNAILTNDIVCDLSKPRSEISMIGPSSNRPYKGTFDGQGHTIKNLSPRVSPDYLCVGDGCPEYTYSVPSLGEPPIDYGVKGVSVFGYLDGATIKNLVLKDTKIIGVGTSSVLASSVYNNSVITNVRVENSTILCIGSPPRISGFIDSISSSTVSKCVVDGFNIEGLYEYSTSVSAFMDTVNSSTIDECCVVNTHINVVDEEKSASGFIRLLIGSSTIKNSYSLCSICSKGLPVIKPVAGLANIVNSTSGDISISNFYYAGRIITNYTDTLPLPSYSNNNKSTSTILSSLSASKSYSCMINNYYSLSQLDYVYSDTSNITSTYWTTDNITNNLDSTYLNSDEFIAKFGTRDDGSSILKIGSVLPRFSWEDDCHHINSNNSTEISLTTTSDNEDVDISMLAEDGDYLAYIDYGDSSLIESILISEGIHHSYSTAGEYVITILSMQEVANMSSTSTSINSIKLSPSVLTISSISIPSLTEISGESVTRLLSNSLSKCTKLSTLNLPKVTYVGEQSLANTLVKSVNWDNCYYDDNALLGSSVESVDLRSTSVVAYRGCSNPTIKSVVNIGPYCGKEAFANTSITALDYTTGDPRIPQSYNLHLNPNIDTIRNRDSKYSSSVMSESQFSNCSKLSEVRLSYLNNSDRDSVASVAISQGYSVFSGCNSLSKLTLTVGDYTTLGRVLLKDSTITDISLASHYEGDFKLSNNAKADYTELPQSIESLTMIQWSVDSSENVRLTNPNVNLINLSKVKVLTLPTGSSISLDSKEFVETTSDNISQFISNNTNNKYLGSYTDNGILYSSAITDSGVASFRTTMNLYPAQLKQTEYVMPNDVNTFCCIHNDYLESIIFSDSLLNLNCTASDRDWVLPGYRTGADIKLYNNRASVESRYNLIFSTSLKSAIIPSQYIDYDFICAGWEINKTTGELRWIYQNSFSRYGTSTEWAPTNRDKVSPFTPVFDDNHGFILWQYTSNYDLIKDLDLSQTTPPDTYNQYRPIMIGMTGDRVILNKNSHLNWFDDNSSTYSYYKTNEVILKYNAPVIDTITMSTAVKSVLTDTESFSVTISSSTDGESYEVLHTADYSEDLSNTEIKLDNPIEAHYIKLSVPNCLISKIEISLSSSSVTTDSLSDDTSIDDINNLSLDDIDKL